MHLYSYYIMNIVSLRVQYEENIIMQTNKA